MIEYIIIFFIAVFVRLFAIRQLIIDFDTWGHIYLGYEVGKQKTSPWGSIYLNCWESDEYRHPYLWHWFVGKFPKKLVINYSKWINGILDAIFATFLYWIFLLAFEEKSNAILGVLLYLFTPMWFSNISIGTRIASFTPRIISEILINLIFVVTFIDLGIESSVRFFIVSFLVSCVLLSSKFGVQALFFIIPLSAILSKSYELLIMFAIGVLVPIILSKGDVLKMLKRQFIHLVEYYNNNILAPNATSQRNKLARLILRTSNGKLNLYGTVWSILATNSYTSVLFKMPVYIVMLTMAITISTTKDINIILNQMFYVPVILTTFIFFIINRPSLLFLGEAERYLSHIAILIIITSIDLASQMDIVWILWLVILYGFIFWLIESFTIGNNFFSNKKERIDSDRIVEKFLLEQNKSKVIASFPYHNFCLYRIMLNTKHKVIFPVHMKEAVRNDFRDNFEIRYAYLNLDKLDEILEVTSLDILIIDKDALIVEGYDGWQPSKENWQEVQLDQSKYYIYEARQSS